MHFTLALAFATVGPAASAKPVLTYFPVAARGEVARLYAIVGDVDIVDNTNTTGCMLRRVRTRASRVFTCIPVIVCLSPVVYRQVEFADRLSACHLPVCGDSN